MYDKAIKDMEAGTGIYDMVYIEQDIIYAYLARDFLVDITQSLKDNPDLKAPTFDEANFTTFANYFKAMTATSSACRWKPSSRSTSIGPISSTIPEIQAAFKEKTGHDLAPATTHEEYTEIAEFFTKWGKDHDMDLWGTTAQAHTGHPASWYEFFESVAPTFGVYNWGINAGRELWRHGRAWRPDEQRQGQGSAEVVAAPARHRSAGIVAEHLDRSGDDLRRRPCGPGPGLWRERRLDRARTPTSPRSSAMSASRFRRSRPASWKTPKSGKGYIGYYDGGAFGLPVTSKNKEASLLFLEYIGAERGAGRLGRGRRRASPTKRPTTIPRWWRWTRSSAATSRCCKKDGHLFAGAPPYPFHAQVREATAPIFYKILTGDIPPDEGLDQMAAKAEEELTNLGYRK